MPPILHSSQVWLPLPAEFGDLDPREVFQRLRGQFGPWLLESALRRPGLGRYSFVGADPYLIMRSRGRDVEWECRRAVHEGLAPGLSLEHDVAPLEALRSRLPQPPQAESPVPFCGGAVGAFGYELAEQLDVHRLHGLDDLGFPEALWLFVDALVGFDHETDRVGISALGMAEDPRLAAQRARDAADRLLDQLTRPASYTAPEAPTDSTAASTLDVAGYRKAVDKVLEAIADGDLYQACLTYRVDVPFAGDPWKLYQDLCERDPAPFAAYFELPEFSLVCSSPERFLRVDTDGFAESRPIKGTAPRSSDLAEDDARAVALGHSAKDQAENLMIVDLVRNDLGRVCETGSIDVPELFAVEPCAAVYHLVSTVRGRLRADCDALDAVEACFPPGSMTGAPKIAAMRLLDHLERHRRGFYSGALGYLDVRGSADLSVVIRTAFIRKGRAFLHTGGGIVADSDPSAEYNETEHKLRALRDALGRAEG